jgi:hypothetical protein
MKLMTGGMSLMTGPTLKRPTTIPEESMAWPVGLDLGWGLWLCGVLLLCAEREDDGLGLWEG